MFPNGVLEVFAGSSPAPSTKKIIMVLIECNVYESNDQGSLLRKPYMFNLKEVLSIRSTGGENTTIHFKNGSRVTIDKSYTELSQIWKKTQKHI